MHPFEAEAQQKPGGRVVEANQPVDCQGRSVVVPRTLPDPGTDQAARAVLDGEDRGPNLSCSTAVPDESVQAFAKRPPKAYIGTSKDVVAQAVRRRMPPFPSKDFDEQPRTRRSHRALSWR